MGAGRNLRSVWTIPTAPFRDAHFATFAPVLAERCIRAGTPERGCCPRCGDMEAQEDHDQPENARLTSFGHARPPRLLDLG
jgi:hypothetical protein